jgi:Putative zinc-finger
MSDRFNELLPWYVNGTLDDADRAWVEQHLAEHPEAREELDWFRSLQTQMRQDVPAVPQTIGLARTLHLIRGDRPTLAERVTGFFASLGMRPGLALAGVALMAVQGGVIHQLLQPGQDDSAEVRALGTPRVETGVLLKLKFAPGTREVDIRMALVAVQGNVAAGPGPQGDYFVRVPASTEKASIDSLKANAAVSSVTLAVAPPKRP